MKNKSGFTLVEVLIVVVIIWILSVALLPKLTGYMARTRDLKRHADLRNIAAAIEMYRNDYGEFPKRGEKGIASYAGSASKLSSSLSNYLSTIPKDPNKKQSIKNLYFYCYHTLSDECRKNSIYFENGEYFYQVNVFSNFAVLLAKVETANMANFVGNGESGKYLRLQCSTIGGNKEGCLHDDRWFFPCSEIIYGKRLKSSSPNDSQCIYTQEDQLYYVVKIE